MKRFVSSSSHSVVAASVCRGVHRVMYSTATPATAGKLRRGYNALLLLLLFLASPLHAQVSNNNPTGASGVFNGLITTGCSYDPFTGNATRSLVDISVAAAVGGYPLALVRTTNSRGPTATGVFGQSGGWNHGYNWILEDSETANLPNFLPTAYTVDFPDGRVETFQSVSWESQCGTVSCYYRVRGLSRPTDPSTSAGVRDRFVPINPHNNPILGYLILPDGGKVEFQAAQHSLIGQYSTLYWYTYKATAIIDPYGLRTQFAYENTPNGTSRLHQVTEPAGRWLRFCYNGTCDTSTNSRKVDHVTASDGRTVQYSYSNIAPGGITYTALTSVNYFGQSQWIASYRYRAPNIAPYSGVPLLWTCDEPMYSGPMKRIAYDYKTGTPQDPIVYGQILSERYYDGATIGVAVSTLTANPSVRTETRADGKTRTFSYSTGGYLQSRTDFMNHTAWQAYDATKYINSVTDARGQFAGDPRYTTNYVNDAITGNVTQVQFPATADVTPSPAPRGTVSYTYGSANCSDPNNRDANNPYYACTATDEGGHVTQFTRDANKRVTRIDYPDGGYETFGYDANHFYQLSSHRMKTGGTETFAYDAYHRKQYYSDPYHSNPGNPSMQYFYDPLDRVNGLLDALGHPTNFAYNGRGQLTVTTLAIDPTDNQRHTITSAYNPDGTLQYKTDELGAYAGDPAHTTNYQYDDYRRLKNVITPVRGNGDNGTYITRYFYDAGGTDDDYRYTDSNATWMILPSGKKIKTFYDDNRRKSTVTVGCAAGAGCGSGDVATTSYGYDNVANVTSVIAPNEQSGQPFSGKSTITAYDERNRPSSITDALNGTPTSFTYDTAGRRKTTTRPNGQIITNVSFDEMNRVTQQSATNQGTTKYTYYPGSGLLETMQDPHLVAINSTDTYSYTYDQMGRKYSVTYPAEPVTGIHRREYFHYDAAGRLQTYTSRANNHQAFTYDSLNRMTDFSWDDGSTPSVHFDYDVASRLIGITDRQPNNGPIIATISRGYFNDNLLRSEAEMITGASTRTVSYTYDADGNRGTLSIPGYSFTYDYTNRNQVKTITDNGSNIISSFWYDKNGNVVQRNPGNGTTSSYTPDALDRVQQIVHTLNGTTRTFNYGYYPNSNNRKWTQRLIVPNSSEHNRGEIFNYDFADQAMAVQVDIANPNTANPGAQSIFYDSNGNRNSYAPPGVNKHYDPDPNHPLSNLNQYTGVVINSSPTYNLSYRADANLAHYDKDNSSYGYDAQNRLTSATVKGTTMSFTYDGLNRQVSRNVNGTTTYSTWDGWDLVEDYHMSGNSAVADATYLYGATGLIKNMRSGGKYYYQDGSGSTSHLADGSGALVEWYRYDLDGTPFFYNPNDTQRNPNQSGYGVRHLFTGQQWYSQIGLYDLRNRFYSPDIGRFLQPDPSGFNGDATNLYRYAGNNPVIGSDPMGLDAVPHDGGYYTYVSSFGMWGLVGSYVMSGSGAWLQCAGAARYLGGGWVNNVWYNMPSVTTWYQGDSLSRATAPGTIVVRNWGPDRRYPNGSISDYNTPGNPLYGKPINHTLVFEYIDEQGKYHLFSQDQYHTIYETIIPADQASQYSEVRVSTSDGPYEKTPSDRSVAGGNGGGGSEVELPPVVVMAPAPFSPRDLGYSGPLSGLGFIGEYFDFYSPGWSNAKKPKDK